MVNKKNLIIEASNLLSRETRKKATGGKIRKIKLDPLAKPEKGLWSKIWDGMGALVGFISSAIKGITFSASAVWGWLTGKIEAIKAFNWNATDEEIQKMMEAQNIGLASAWGTVAGQTFGWSAGIVVGAGIGLICPVIGGGVLATAIATAVATEGVQEVLSSVTSALWQTANVLVSKMALSGYINYRKILKNVPYSVLSKVYGKQTADFIKYEWGVNKGPEMSFNKWMDEQVESLSGDNKVLKAFLENAFEEAWDSFIEAGFVIAEELDKAFADAKAGSQQALGKNRIIKITPDKRKKEETVTIAGPQSLALPVIAQTLATAQLLGNRDVGVMVAQPMPEYLKGKFQLRKLSLEFKAKEKPPWKKGGKSVRTAEISIPEVKRGLTWREIKNACRPYNYGPWHTWVDLDCGRPIHIYAATKQEGKSKIQELLVLTNAKPIGEWHHVEHESANPKRKKATEKMYPAFATLLWRKNSMTGDGRIDLAGNLYEETEQRFEIWPDQEPLGLKPLG